MATVMKTYKYKFYRNRGLVRLGHLIEWHCEVYNYCIALHRRYYKMYGKYLSANKLKTHLTKVRKRPGKEHWRQLGSQSIQDVAERIDRSYKAALSIAGQYTDVCVEDLNMQGMQKLWGRKVSDYAFSEFVKILEYELGQTGGRLRKVNRFFPSSKTCSYCGHQVDSLPLSVRTWECPSCHRQLDRDVNAARCILAQAMK